MPGFFFRRLGPWPVLVALALLGCREQTGSKPLPPLDIGSSKVVGAPRLLELNAGGGLHETTETSLDFGRVPVGQRARREIVIRNTGRAPLTVVAAHLEGAAASQFLYDAPGFTLPPDGQVAYGVTFRPTSRGDRSGTLTLQVEDGDVFALVVHLRGTATTPACEPSTDDLDFDGAAIGTTRAMDLTLTNDEDSPTAIVIAPLASDEFAFGSGFVAGSKVIPARAAGVPGALTIPITFTPKRTTESTAQLEITRPTECAGHILLRGVGVDRHLVCEPTPASASPQVCRLFFGYVNPGTTVVDAAHFRNLTDHAITVTLRGIREPPSQGHAFTLDPTRTLVLVPAGGFADSVAVSFAPEQLGAMNAVLDYTTDDPSQPTGTVELVGVGGGPALEVEPAALHLGRAAVGAQSTKRLTLTNVGAGSHHDPTDNLLLAEKRDGRWNEKRAEIIGPNASEFATDWPPAGYTSAGIEEDQPVFLAVRLQPTSAGAKSATLVIYSNDLATPVRRVPLSGTALDLPECDFEIRPPSLDFGAVDPQSAIQLRFSFVNKDLDPAHACIISSAELFAPRGGFQFVADAVDDVLVEGGGVLTVPVVFLPPVRGQYSGEVDLSISSASQSLARVALTGQSDATCLMIAPGSYDFGMTSLGCDAAPLSLTAYDLCGTGLIVSDVALRPESSNDFSFFHLPGLPATIPPNGSVQFGVSYRASAAGEAFAVIALTTSAGSPVAIPVNATAMANAVETEVFSQAARMKLDVLFVIDTSMSMADKPTASNLHAFIDRLVQQPIDYHVGVTTTDLTTEAGRLVPLTGPNPRIITPSTPNKREVFDSNVALALGRGETESLLRPVFLALSRPLATGHNQAFYRDEALLSIVIVSDAADTDPKAEPVRFYEDFLLNLKGLRRRNDVMISGVLATQSQPPDGCSYDYAGAGQDSRARDLVTWAAGRWTDICTSDWSSVLEDLTTRTTYFLAKRPDLSIPDAIVIRVDGVTYPRLDHNGAPRWRYDSASNAVVFADAAAPSRSSTLTVTYLPACE